MSPQDQRVYRSGQWTIDLGRRKLRAQGVLVPLGNRAFEILEVLVSSAGDVVSKTDLMSSVWQGAIVEVHKTHRKRAFPVLDSNCSSPPVARFDCSGLRRRSNGKL